MLVLTGTVSDQILSIVTKFGVESGGSSGGHIAP